MRIQKNLLKEDRGELNRIIKGLTPAQKEAVTTIEGPVLILAGAGSGKTKVITHRIAYMILSGINPESILGLTFTNKAAEEMKERVALILNDPTLYKRIFLSTFHSFCLWVLRRFAYRLDGFGNNFTVVDETDQIGIVKEILNRMGLDTKRFPPKAISSFISNVKNGILEAEGLLKDIYEEYQHFLKVNNYMDFDDLLINTLQLLNDTVVLDFLHSRFNYIMVDEYQDTNQIQYLIVQKLAQKSRNICVVGDDDQAIYSWRGADVRNILSFENDFPEAKVFKLEENFRSTDVILEAAWHVIKNNTKRKDKKLFSKKRAQNRLVLFEARDENEEAEFIASRIEKLKDKLGIDYSDFAVFYRTNFQSRVIEEALSRRGIPYSIIGGIRFYDRKEIKDIIAYLRLIRNPDDVVAFKRIINTPPRGIGEKTRERILNYCTRVEEGLWAGIKRIIAQEGIIPKSSAKKLGDFVKMMEEFILLKDILPLSELVEAVMERTGYLKMLEENSKIESAGRLENLKELINVVSDYDDDENGLDLFLDRASITTTADTNTGEKGVNLMTLHSAKGLEFEVVFITGLEEGLIPHVKSMENEDEIEEERRLMYVGMTRAKNRLYLTYAKTRKIRGVPHNTQKSRFLDEIPDTLFETDDKKIKNDEEFLEGNIVMHPKFGKGVIVAVKGKGENLKLKVKFYKFGTKLILAHLSGVRKVG